MAGKTWSNVKLSEIIDVKHGFAFPGENIREDPPGDILLTPGNFAVGGGFKGDKYKYFDGQVPEEYVLLENDLIVTMTDLSKQADTLGYPALVPKPQHFRFLHNQRLGKVLIRDDAKVDKRFISYLLRTPGYRHEVLASATGTTVKHTSPSRILAFKTSIPPLPEQRAIAHILGTLDDRIELNRRMNETLEAMARVLFKSWFVDFEPVRAKAEGRDPGLPQPLADLFPDHCEDSELGNIPAGWRVGPILEAARLLSGGTPKTDRAEYWGGGIPWASAKDVSQCDDSFLVETERKITERGLKESATQLIPALCSAVVARGATTGRMVVLGEAMAMNQTCYALETSAGTPFALYCQLRHAIDHLVHAAHGSVFDTITTSTFATSKVVLPQRPLLREFELRVDSLFRRVLAGIKASRVLASLRDTLLPKLISGELRVKDAERIVLMDHLRRLGNSISIPIPADESAFTGRECPHPDCEGYFKIELGTGLKGEGLPCHCPYCGHTAGHDHFWTKEQIEYAKSVAMRKITDALHKDLKKLEFDHKPKGAFGIGISMKVKPGRATPIHYYREKQLETEVVCVNCTLRYSVYGVFAFCPDCGQHNSLQILDKNLEVVGRMLDLAAGAEKVLAEKLIENALEDCVSAFDGFGRELCRLHANRARNPARIEKMSFQNLEGAKTTFLDLFGIDLSAEVAPEEWRAAAIGFQKRHLVTHKLGVVDQEYITKTGDTRAVVGRKIGIGADEVRGLARIISKLAPRLSDNLQKLGTSP